MKLCSSSSDNHCSSLLSIEGNIFLKKAQILLFDSAVINTETNMLVVNTTTDYISSTERFEETHLQSVNPSRISLIWL